MTLSELQAEFDSRLTYITYDFWPASTAGDIFKGIDEMDARLSESVLYQLLLEGFLERHGKD